jgi:putative chitobiose transport system permease protein
MEEAARVDGAGEFRLWWQVMFPLTKPAVATLAIFTFVGSWSSFLWPLIILTTENKLTLPVALAMLSGVFVDRISYLAAGSVIAIAPVILFFLFLQRWFLGGMTLGAVKG